MGIFNDYMREGKGIDKSPDNRLRIVVFFDIYFRKFWNLILINLLYLLSCLPIITIGPATAAVSKILRNYAREEHAFIFSDFWETFKQNFWKSIGISVLNVILFSILYFDISFFLSNNEQIINVSSTMPPLIRIISLAVTLSGLVLLLFFNYYVFTMLVTFKLNFKQLLKNSFIFALIGFWRNILITIILAIITLLVYIYLLPVGGVFLILLYFSTCGLIINFITYPLIKKHMIDGYDPNTGEKIEEKKDTQD